MKLIMTCDKNDSNYKVLDYMLSVTTKGAYFKYVYNYVYYDLRRKELVSSDRVQLHLVKGFKVKGMTEGLYSITKKGSCMSLSKIESDMSFPRYDHLITEWKNNSSYVKTTLRHPLKDVLFCKIIRLLRDDLIIRYEYFLNIIKYLSPSADFDVHINNEDISPVIICAKISGYDIISLIMPEAVM